MPSSHLILSYNGSAFHGWQIQPGVRTVEGTLRDALAHIHAEVTAMTAASRTDAGVHAYGQSVALTYEKDVSAARLQHALNGVLPPDVRVMDAQDISSDFHATRDAIGKHYRYQICCAACDDPCTRHMHWWVKKPLDTQAMHAAAAHLIGTRDFSGIKVISRGNVQESVRTVDVIHIEETGDMLTIHVFGRAFMYKMVRSLVGILYAVGRGMCAPDDVPLILSGDPVRRRTPVAPAHGLALMTVYYIEDDYRRDADDYASGARVSLS